MDIEKLKKLEVDKITPEALQKAVKELIHDYDNAENKEAFKEIASDNISKVYELVVRLSPKAIPKEPVKKKKEDSSKAKESKKPTGIQDELDSLTEAIETCRVKIRAYNKEKRANEPKKPKPTRHAKIKSHFLSIINLIPPGLKENEEVHKEAEKVLLKAHRDIMNAYKINTVRAQKGEQAIKEKFSKLGEKSKNNE